MSGPPAKLSNVCSTRMLGVRNGRGAAQSAAAARRGVSARRRAAAPWSRARSGMASGAGSAAAPCHGLAHAAGRARSRPPRTLPALRPGFSPVAEPTTAVLGVAHRARPPGWWVAGGCRPVSRRAPRSEVNAVVTQPHEWIDLPASRVPHLEVQVRSGRVAPVSHLGDLLAGPDLLALFDQ